MGTLGATSVGDEWKSLDRSSCKVSLINSPRDGRDQPLMQSVIRGVDVAVCMCVGRGRGILYVCVSVCKCV